MANRRLRDQRQIASSRSPLKNLSVYGVVGDLTAVSGGYGKSDAHLPSFFGRLENRQLLHRGLCGLPLVFHRPGMDKVQLNGDRIWILLIS
jgi:hypothetical protein